jgi:hypothetical protein
MCGREIEGHGERIDGVLYHWGCARLARWRINHPGESDPFWADPSLPLPEKFRLEPVRDFAFRRLRKVRRPSR